MKQNDKTGFPILTKRSNREPEWVLPIAFAVIVGLVLWMGHLLYPPQPISPLPTPASMSAIQAPGDFILDGLLKMKVGKEGGAIALVPRPGDVLAYDSVPLDENTLVYATVNRLTGERVELDKKVHVAWWDAGAQRWRAGWVNRDALIYR